VKSAYEIAMARLEKEAGPSQKLSESQKAEIAALKKKYDARAAEEKLAFDTKMASVTSYEELERLRAELATALGRVESDRERAEEAVRGRD